MAIPVFDFHTAEIWDIPQCSHPWVPTLWEVHLFCNAFTLQSLHTLYAGVTGFCPNSDSHSLIHMDLGTVHVCQLCTGKRNIQFMIHFTASIDKTDSCHCMAEAVDIPHTCNNSRNIMAFLYHSMHLTGIRGNRIHFSVIFIACYACRMLIWRGRMQRRKI